MKGENFIPSSIKGYILYGKQLSPHQKQDFWRKYTNVSNHKFQRKFSEEMKKIFISRSEATSLFDEVNKYRSSIDEAPRQFMRNLLIARIHGLLKNKRQNFESKHDRVISEYEAQSLFSIDVNHSFPLLDSFIGDCNDPFQKKNTMLS